MRLFLEKALRNTFLFTIFATGIVLGRYCWTKIFLPFSNPFSIIGELSLVKYNPLNDVVRFLVFLTLPVLLLSLTYVFSSEKFKGFLYFSNRHVKDVSRELSFAKTRWIAILFLIFAALIALNQPTSQYSGELDTFHEGETLGPAISLAHGQVPYKDFLFLHGIYENPLRSVIAFNLFGRSISSSRIVNSINNLLLFTFIALLLINLYKKNHWYYYAVLMIIAFLLFIHQISFRHMSRDMTIYAFLITVTLLYGFIINRPQKGFNKKFILTSFLFSFIPIASWGYSIDRGMLISATYILITPILFFAIPNYGKVRIYFFTAAFLGALFSVLFLGFLLHWEFYAFIEFAVLKLPKYKGFLDGKIYPIWSKSLLIACTLIAANVYWMGCRFFKVLYSNRGRIMLSTRNFLQLLFIEFSMLLLSVFTFYLALSRSDGLHVQFALPMTYILSTYILIKHVFPHNLFRIFPHELIKAILICMIIVSSFFLCWQIFKADLIKKNFPFGIEDSKWIPADYKRTIAFLKNNLGDNEDFLTMTNEAIWYYFIDRPSPVRFPVIWFAAPDFYQNEVVEDLRGGNVKFILFKNRNWTSSIDEIQTILRLPIITRYIKKNYTFYKIIDGNEIWIKKAR